MGGDTRDACIDHPQKKCKFSQQKMLKFLANFLIILNINNHLLFFNSKNIEHLLAQCVK
jgi:hypothetical protein